MTRKILIVEDELSIAEVLIAYSKKEGYRVDHLMYGDEVLPHLDASPADLVLLDIMLPNADGFALCRQISHDLSIPVMIISAKVAEEDRLAGLTLGADDYICKPFSPNEVMARVKVVLKRWYGLAPDKSQGLVVDDSNYGAMLNGVDLALTPAEYKILRQFIRYPERVFSREEIINALYDDIYEGSDRSVDNHIKNLRKKINRIAPNYNPFEAVYGVGYKLKTRKAKG